MSTQGKAKDKSRINCLLFFVSRDSRSPLLQISGSHYSLIRHGHDEKCVYIIIIIIKEEFAYRLDKIALTFPDFMGEERKQQLSRYPGSSIHATGPSIICLFLIDKWIVVFSH